MVAPCHGVSFKKLASCDAKIRSSVDLGPSGVGFRGYEPKKPETGYYTGYFFVQIAIANMTDLVRYFIIRKKLKVHYIRAQSSA